MVHDMEAAFGQWENLSNGPFHIHGLRNDNWSRASQGTKMAAFQSVFEKFIFRALKGMALGLKTRIERFGPFHFAERL